MCVTWLADGGNACPKAEGLPPGEQSCHIHKTHCEPAAGRLAAERARVALVGRG